MSAKPKAPYEKVRKHIKKAEIAKLAKDLVRIPSHCDVPTQEKEVAEYLNEFLQDEGVDSKLRLVEKNRPNVIAVLEGSGDGQRLLLSGHTDTVPPYEMDIPPFTPKVQNGRLYGRGALDMKGSIGSMAMTLVAFRRAKVKLDGDLLLAAVVGEERRSEGTEDLILHGPRADFGIVGEPTDLEIQPSHRGLEWFEVHFHGRAAHGGQAEKGSNAISMAARFVKALEEDLLPKLRAKKAKYTLPPTLNVGVIQGGQQPSAVADHCVVRIDRRWVPEESLQQVFQEMYDLLDKLKQENATFKAKILRDPSNMLTMTHVPNVVSTSHPLVRSLQQSAKLVTHHSPKVTTFWGWTDAALMTHFGKTPTVVFGPGGAGAHARVEYVNLEDLVKCSQIFSLVALDMCGCG